MADHTAQDRRFRAPGGWRRALLGFLVGAAVGLAVALVLPRDDGPRRPPPRDLDDVT